ncbi:DUF222 domain-containing protein [Mycobacterium lepromatosis]|uniref:DUF222 domain-containing protein n=1 Tax=Mycobacterium lepromatosis TaxID=480418 RepID=UPI000B2101BC
MLMRNPIRMASQAYRYLAVCDEHSNHPLCLRQTRQVTSPDQRVVLYAKDRYCTSPAATYPAIGPKFTI